MMILLPSKKHLGIALLFSGLVGAFLPVGITEAQEFPQEIPLLNRDVVLLDCVEEANAFVVKSISLTGEVNINQGGDCAEAVQDLLAIGYVLGPGAGGVTSGIPTSLNHFLMLFVLDRNIFIEPVLNNPEPLAPIIQRPAPLPPPIFPRPEPLGPPVFQSPKPLTPLLQRPDR